MKNSISLFILFVSCVGVCCAQDFPTVPNGAVVKDTRDYYDKGIRIRSIELERIKRDANRTAVADKTTESRRINYLQIKKDFEQVQLLQNAIVKTYVTGKQINYAKIGELAVKLNDCAARLDKNLSLTTETSAAKSQSKNSVPEDVKDLIVVLDKSIGKLVTNPVFENLQIIETKDAKKAEFELQNIIRLSHQLALSADKQK